MLKRYITKQDRGRKAGSTYWGMCQLQGIAGCEDEAVIAMNLRKNAAKGQIKVAVDGRSLSLGNHKELMDHFDAVDLKTVYLEGNGTVKLDDSFIRSLCCKSGLEEGIVSITIHPKQIFAFIQFQTPAQAQSLVNYLSWKKIDTNTHSILHHPSSCTVKPVLRALLKSEWTSRMIEYHTLTNLTKTLKDQKKRHDKLVYQPGLVASFSGLHPNTHPKTIKHLLQIVSPVTFVTMHGEGRGYVRFKTWQDALQTQSYFSRTLVSQAHEGDSRGVLDVYRSKARFKAWAGGRDDLFPNAVTLRIIEGREEEEYWEEVGEWQAYVEERNALDDDVVAMDEDAVQIDAVQNDDAVLHVDEAQNDDAVQNEELQKAHQDQKSDKKRKKKGKTGKAVHVVFADSDEEDDDGASL